MKYILILALFLTGCSGGGGGSSTPQKTGVAVFCDSIGYTNIANGATGFPYLLKDLISEKVWSDCRPGATLSDYNIEVTINKALIANKYKYGIIALGGNDILKGKYLGDVLDEYERNLKVITDSGMEPVCLVYPYNTVAKDKVNPLNDGVKFICEGYKTIQASDQLWDGIHPTNAGSMETAERIWRALY